jgi:predicted nucleic acid-binding protein
LVRKIIIADSGPLIAFGKIKMLSLLIDTLGTIIMPAAVSNECLSNLARPGAKEIAAAIENNLIKVHENPAVLDKEVIDILGVGESNAITLASQLGAGLLIDDKLGRKVAVKMKLPVIGTAGVLLLAKNKKLIKQVAPVIQELKNNSYFLSKELIATILKRVGE